MNSERPLIALDADGVLLNYNMAFPRVHEKAFGKPLPKVRSAYHARNVYDLYLPKGTPGHDQFFAHFQDEDWEAMPALEGAVEACHELHDAGYRLVCVSSMPPEFADARRRNFRALGFPIEQLIAVGRHGEGNPKLEVIHELAPVAFVDDLASNFQGVHCGVHKALIEYGHFDSPNQELDPALADSQHGSLWHFAQWWLREQR